MTMVEIEELVLMTLLKMIFFGVSVVAAVDVNYYSLQYFHYWQYYYYTDNNSIKT